MALARNLAAHKGRASVLPSAVGSAPPGSPGPRVYPRSACDGAGGHRPARGVNGPGLDGAAAAGRAPVVAAPAERSTPGDCATAPSWGHSQGVGRAPRGQARQLCPGWPRVRDGTSAPTPVAGSMGPVRRGVEQRQEKTFGFSTMYTPAVLLCCRQENYSLS
jgi:hypothetical protein